MGGRLSTPVPGVFTRGPYRPIPLKSGIYPLNQIQDPYIIQGKLEAEGTIGDQLLRLGRVSPACSWDSSKMQQTPNFTCSARANRIFANG